MPYDTLTNLKELARIVNAAMPKRRLVLSREDLHDEKNIYGQFFNALISGEFASEEDMAKSLLHVSAESDKYRMAKSRFKVILLNTLFHLDLKGAGRSNWNQTQQDVSHALLHGRTALSWDARELAKSIALNALKEARQYELWYDAMGLATLLLSISALEGNAKDHVHYWSVYEEVRAFEYADERARKRMEELMIPFAKSGAEKPELATRARRYVLETGRAFHRHQTFGLALNYWRIRCGYYQIRMDYHAPLAACDELDELLKDRFSRFDAPYLRAELEKKRVVCHFQLGEYPEAGRALVIAEQWEENGSTNWFVLREYAFVIDMHLARFSEARKDCLV